ncbi:AAA family ATPase [Thiomicrorhabdus sp. 6S2-11]|uniref:AAA family ATPase n=1 Tax=Thiomicrorhabdus marina TaxID=2818442 RepID=A0ABS3Q5W4_9GAMM|nr:AAA family ATPase [Thiomicrorhabdus marina]MBO1927369.1 AAA family ATPase [Thiomicrorhabdus marina]
MNLVRITAIYQSNAKHVNFSAILVDDQGNCIDARTVVYVRTTPSHISLEPALGQVWQVEGACIESEQSHGSYVMKAKTYTEPKLTAVLPSSNEAFVRFLTDDKDFKGIGESKARELWNTFGSQIFEICEKQDIAVLTNHLTKKSLESLLRGYEKYSNLKYTQWMTEKEIPLAIQKRLIKLHKTDSVEQIKQNPYHLVTMGLNFKQADAIAQKHFGYQKDSENRLSAAIEDSLRKHSEKGHTIAKASDLKPRLETLLGAYGGLVEKAFTVGANKLSFIKQDERYHLTSTYIMEQVVAKRFKLLASQVDDWSNEHQNALQLMLSELPYALTSEQIEAISTSMKNHISCITGGAGTGKTTVIRTALRAMNETGFTIIPVALAGRAAKRMHESIGFITTTIARLLREKPVEQGKKLLVIDEAGMVDIATMYRLVKHIHPDCRILMVGDSYQLPPIGSGVVLNDTIKSNAVAVSELTIVQRQSSESGVPDYANAIKNGELPNQLNSGCISFHHSPDDFIAKQCVELMIQSSLDAMILAPTKQMVSEINLLAQDLKNPNGIPMELSLFEQKYRTEFRLGDPVIFTKNNYQAGVQNGSLGKLVSIENWGAVELEDGSVLELDNDLFDSLSLAYAITLHKAQGSQFEHVIVALKGSRIVDRSWLYTAVTRVESKLDIVGSELTFNHAVQRQSASNIRQTYLAELIAQSS